MNDIGNLANEIAARAITEARAIIDRAFAGLSSGTPAARPSPPPPKRAPLREECVRLYREGLPIKEIASRAGTTPGTVGQYIYQARQMDPSLRRYKVRR